MSKKITLLLLLQLLCCRGFSQLIVANTGTKQVQVAIGYYTKATLNSGWTTSGWYIIEPNQTNTLINAPLDSKYYYLYGQVVGCDSEYSGTTGLIIDPVNAFTVYRADQAKTLEINPQFAVKKFMQLDVEDRTLETVTLTQANCSLNGKREGEWTVYFDRDWEETQIAEDASFYRKIRYTQGIPTGIVRDYYISGKKQWEGKLKSENPDILHGTCTWYYENGNKAQECVYDNGKLVGDYKEWTEDGIEIKYHRTYKVEPILAPQNHFINNPYRLGGINRIIIPIQLPENTVSWYYSFAATRDSEDVKETQASLSLFGDLVNLVDETKMASIAINLLTKPTGADVCNVYLLDEENSAKFSRGEMFNYRLHGSRENFTSGTVPIQNFTGTTHYLGVENPTAFYGIHFSVEVVAVTASLERSQE